jgi:hypothetical protein
MTSFGPKRLSGAAASVNPRRGQQAPFGATVLVVSALGLAGCASNSLFHPPAETSVAVPANPARAAAIAEMRQQAEEGDRMPFPDAYQTEQTTRLAHRDEPRSVEDVRAVEAELTEIAARRARTTDPHELAALDARAKELLRLALASETLRP